MKQQPVTVVIPCHNREATVERAIRSVLNQTYRNLTIIAVDDASSDRTLEILESIQDDRFSYEALSKQSGAAAARNFGAAIAQTPWIAFQDSDDVWHPEKLEKQMRAAEKENPAAVFCAMATYEGTRLSGYVPKPEMKLSPESIANKLLQDSFISTQTVLLKTDVFKAISGMDESFKSLDDWDMMIRVAQTGAIHFLDEVLVDQHMSHNSITHDLQKRLDAQIQILKKHQSLLNAEPAILAVHLHRIAGGFRQTGRPFQGLRYAARAAWLQPYNFRFFFQTLACLVQSITFRIAKTVTP